MLGTNGSPLTMLQLYGGNCLLLLAFAVSLIFLFVKEKDKTKRAVVIYLPIAVLFLFFFPPLSKFWIEKMGEEQTYYRFLWMLPEAFVCGYALVRFLELVKWKWLKIIVTVVVTVCVMIGGNLVYNSPVFTKAQNLYQVPDSVIEICDEIIIPGREIRAAFPDEILQYVRQYTAFVVLPYGYETMVSGWGFYDELHEEMIKEVSDAGELARLGREEGCHYIILNKNHLVDGEIEEYDYRLFMESGDYLVYKNMQADFFIPELLK